MRRLDERFLFTPTKSTVINESNAGSELPGTVFEYVKLENGKTLLKVEGIVGDYVNPNGNNRIYEEQVWDHVLESTDHIIASINESNAWGVVEHPDDGETVLGEVSHRILSLRKDESTKKIIAEVLLVDTRAGQDIRAMLESGGTVGMSTRGLGDTYQKNGHDYVQVGFICETIDFVAVNSVKDAKFNIKHNAQESKSTDSSEGNSMEESVESKEELPPLVNSNSDESTVAPINETMEKPMLSLKSKRLEVASLQVIAESKANHSQVEAVKETVSESLSEIKSAIKEGSLDESEASSVIASYEALLERVEENSPMARELKESKENMESLSERYETLKTLSTGLFTRFEALKENYNGLEAESKKPVEGSETPTISEADVIASKRYQTLLSLAEGLVERNKRSVVIAESAKAKVAKLKESTSKPVLAEAQISALKTEGLSDKASNLILRCESVEQVSKVLERVKQLKESAPKKSVVESKPKVVKTVVESQAHIEPLPTGKKTNESVVAKPTEELHECLSVVQRMRKNKA